MTPFNYALCNLIFNRDESCVLCFQPTATIDAIRVQDEVLLVDETDTLEIRKIMGDMFGFEIVEHLTMFHRICEICVKSILESYTFIKKCKSNLQNIRTAVACLADCSDNSIGDVYNYKTLFIAVDTDASTSKQLYCDSKFATVSEATSQFQGLSARLSAVSSLLCIKENFNTPINNRCRKKSILHEMHNRISVVVRDHQGKKKFKCKFCPIMFTEFSSCKRHHANFHTEPAPSNPLNKTPAPQNKKDAWFACNVCGNKFKDPNNLRNHELRHVARFTCSKCGKVYKNQYYFRKHACRDKNQEYVTLPKTFFCEICGQGFTKREALDTHIRYMHDDTDKKHPCSYCPRKFDLPSRLKAHIVKHTKEKNYKCELCEGLFVSKASLLYHTRLHTGERPYKCKHCDQSFLSASRRADHMRSKHMEPSLECSVCFKKFKTYNAISKHKKLHSNPNSSLYVSNSVPNFCC